MSKKANYVPALLISYSKHIANICMQLNEKRNHATKKKFPRSSSMPFRFAITEEFTEQYNFPAVEAEEIMLMNTRFRKEQ